jgi:hypothetical protein
MFAVHCKIRIGGRAPTQRPIALERPKAAVEFAIVRVHLDPAAILCQCNRTALARAKRWRKTGKVRKGAVVVVTISPISACTGGCPRGP